MENTKLTLPKIGFGTADLNGDVCQIVLNAIKQGYRLIDTAAVYGSEEAVGAAVKAAIDGGIVKREELIIETKLAPGEHGYDKTMAVFEQSLGKLGLDYIDVYLIHWPVSRGDEGDYREKNLGSWKAFSELKAKGLIKHIGVCNFLERHLLHLIESGYGTPEINQLELHPAYQQRGLVTFCRERGIAIEAWSPMGRGVLNTEEFIEMAAKYGKDTGQLALRWSVQKGFVPLTRTSTPSRAAGNLNIFDFNISDEDMKKLDALNTNDNHADIWSYKRQQMY